MYIYFILLVLVEFVVINASLRLQQSMEQCKSTGSSMICDFEDTEEVIIIEPDFTSTGALAASSLFVHNAANVAMPKPLCADLSFFNIGHISFNPHSHCENRMASLKLVDSSTDTVPRQLSRLELTRSRAEKVSTDMGLQKLLISSSYVGEFNVPWPISSQITLKIEHSTIEKFMDLKVEGKTIIVLNNVTIHHMPIHSLTIGRDGMAIISNSDIRTNENAVVLKEGGKLTVNHLSGMLHVAGWKIGSDDLVGRRPPGIPKPKTMNSDQTTTKDGMPAICQTTSKSSLWLWLLPSLVALCEAILLLVCWCKSVGKQQRYKSKSSESYGDGGFNVHIGDLQGQPYGSNNVHSNDNNYYRRR